MQASAQAAPASTDRIEKIVNLDAPPSRVWRAITEHKQFGQWFGIALDGPFTPGAPVTGRMNNPKYAHIPVTFWIESLEPERYFAFRWHPYAIEEGVDYVAEPTTLVSFTLEPAASGTRLTIVEAGFDAIPEARRAKAFSMDEKGWTAQAENIRKFVGG
jgi:uncharacterized protein YndB with AHSA1/START domain